MPAECKLYQYVLSQGGYVVFRRGPNEPPPDYGYALEYFAFYNRMATFVTETEAKDYCEYRNRLVDIFGDDEVPREYELRSKPLPGKPQLTDEGWVSG